MIVQWSIVFFPANDAPRWRKGMISIIVLTPILLILTTGTRILQLRDQKRVENTGSPEENGQDPGELGNVKGDM